MSLADALLADLDGLSDGEAENRSPSPPPVAGPSRNGNGVSSNGGKGPGSMLPPPLPTKGKGNSMMPPPPIAGPSSNGAGPSSGIKRSAASLLEDLEGEDDDVDADANGSVAGDGEVGAGYVPEGGVRPADELDEDDVAGVDMTGYTDVGVVAKLHKGRRLKEVLEGISEYSTQTSNLSSSTIIEENAEYHLVVSANNMSVEVENEILLVHKFIRDHYAPRFPELEQLISDPWTYIAAVRAIGNAEDLTRAVLPSSLPAATILSISLSATGSQGRLLSDAEWMTVERAADVAEELRTARETIFAYVESRMAAVAPNISAIVGTNIAAKLLGLAGGLHALSRQPSCNIMLFGAMKKSLANSHLSVASQQRHTGFIFQSAIVQSAQPEDRRRAQRAVSAKVALAARTDAAKGSRTGDYGRKVLVELQKKIEKMAEPPPNKISKALPIPQETNRKKRGGKRARAQKEAYATTELRKMQNRMEFGKAEEETGMDDETVGLGMIGAASGRVRGDQVDARSKAKLSRANKIRTQLLGKSLSSDAASGTSTSLSFTPVQGIEIVTPSLSAAQRVQAANERWFAGGTFTHVKKGGSSLPGQGGSGSGA